MRVLVAGGCGFVGSAVARTWRAEEPGVALVAVDHLGRPGSEGNRALLRREGITVVHADLRSASDVDALPPAEWVVDAAANPSVLAGVDGRATSRHVVEHNVLGTVNLLEYCRRHRAGLIFLSSSRVYSLSALAALPLDVDGTAFRLRTGGSLPAGVGAEGLDEGFPTAGPVSLYGASKLAAETLALEYGDAFGFPVWIDRCGNLAGAGQFGRPDQGILAWWINAWLRGRPLRYSGFGGRGLQVRDFLHARDLVPLLRRQVAGAPRSDHRVFNVGGGPARSLSLGQLSAWCERRFGPRPVEPDLAPRPYDAPWIVMDARRAAAAWDWRPSVPLGDILDEVAEHAEAHPDWLEASEA